jgi:hypothetical protein
MQHHAIEKLNKILCIGVIRPIPPQIEDILYCSRTLNVNENAWNFRHCECQRNKPHLHTQENEHTINRVFLLRSHSQVQ